jgi:tetratricopeptide (TPR) repeat protein
MAAVVFAITIVQAGGCRGKHAPPPAAVHYEKGVALAAKGDAPGAVAAWQMAIAMEPSDPRPYLALAEQMEQAGNPGGALSVLKNLEAARPETPHLECHIARLLLTTGHVEQAMSRGERAIASDPDCGVARSIRGMALAEIGETDAAITELKAARQLAPQNERIALTLAQVLGRVGRRVEAKKRVDDVLAAAPNSPDALYLRGWLLLQSPGGVKDAEATLRRVLALDADHARAHAALGALYLRSKRFADARRHLERAGASRPDDPEIARDLAVAYQRLGDPRGPTIAKAAAARSRLQERWRELFRRYRKSPGDAAVTLELARVERELGSPEEALERVRSILRKDPNHPGALRLMHELLRGE